MQEEAKTEVVFKFRHPAGTAKKPPSREMSEALQCLSEAEEMQAFVANARAQHRTVVVEVFHAREGHPLLIHTAAVPKEKA